MNTKISAFTQLLVSYCVTDGHRQITCMSQEVFLLLDWSLKILTKEHSQLYSSQYLGAPLEFMPFLTAEARTKLMSRNFLMIGANNWIVVTFLKYHCWIETCQVIRNQKPLIVHFIWMIYVDKKFFFSFNLIYCLEKLFCLFCFLLSRDTTQPIHDRLSIQFLSRDINISF